MCSGWGYLQDEDRERYLVAEEIRRERVRDAIREMLSGV